VVWGGIVSLGGIGGGEGGEAWWYIPSGLHAATKVTTKARKERARSDKRMAEVVDNSMNCQQRK
jgi:hypothetical protein